jgi:hypothetical protein
MLLYAFACNTIRACDVCGCATNATYFGILPQFRQHFIGVRYMNNSFTSKQLPSLFEVKNPLYHESLQRMEIYGRYYPTDRLQLFAFIPYQYNVKNDGGVITESKGLSDINLLGNYIVLNTGDSGGRLWRNTLSVGAGVKLPTGRFNASEAASLQTGSGTFDYLLNAIYTTRYKKVGLNIDVNARINTTGNSYRYGNRITSSARFFYWHKYKMISVLPHTGLLAEYAGKDRKYGNEQRYTGGNGYYAAAGIDVYLRKISVGAVYTLPIYEKLNAGYAQTNYRLSVQALYLF